MDVATCTILKTTARKVCQNIQMAHIYSWNYISTEQFEKLSWIWAAQLVEFFFCISSAHHVLYHKNASYRMAKTFEHMVKSVIYIQTKIRVHRIALNTSSITSSDPELITFIKLYLLSFCGIQDVPWGYSILYSLINSSGQINVWYHLLFFVLGSLVLWMQR